jgi:hypothetical protein
MPPHIACCGGALSERLLLRSIHNAAKGVALLALLQLPSSQDQTSRRPGEAHMTHAHWTQSDMSLMPRGSQTHLFVRQ